MGVITSAVIMGLGWLGSAAVAAAPIVGAAAGIATGISALTGDSGAQAPPPPPPVLPTLETPTPEISPQVKAVTQKAEEEARRETVVRRAKRTRTLLTGPRGALGTAQTEKKVLLGS